MKIRSAFVANSSSSSFLIVGVVFDSEADAMLMQEKLTGRKYGFRYSEYKGDYIAGFNVDPGLADGCSGNAIDYLKKVQAAIDKLKAAGIENPTYRGYAGYDG